MLKARCRTVAMLAGPHPVRDRALSLPKVTSGTRWRLFLIAQWLRTAPARVCGVIGRDATQTRKALVCPAFSQGP